MIAIADSTQSRPSADRPRSRKRSLALLAWMGTALAVSTVLCLAATGLASAAARSGEPAQTPAEEPTAVPQVSKYGYLGRAAGGTAIDVVADGSAETESARVSEAPAQAPATADGISRYRYLGTVGKGPTANPGADSPLVAGIVLSAIAVAACAAVAFGLRRGQGVRKPAAAAPLISTPITGREHRTAT